MTWIKHNKNIRQSNQMAALSTKEGNKEVANSFVFD